MENRQLYVAHAAGRRLAAAALWAWLAGPASAAALPDARVEAVQWPAWVERDGRREPAQAGVELRASDRLLTGKNARLLIRLADGSAVKLGEQADVALGAIDRRAGVLEAAIEVGKGAFRFTTGLFKRVLGQRAVQVRVSTLTIGIRGTDVWGKSDAERDLVLLIEGKISVAHARPGEAAAEHELATPLEYLTAPRGQAAERRATDSAQLAAWAKETELDPVRPGGSAGSRHAATVAVAASEVEALAWREKLRAAGYPVRLSPLKDARYALRVEHLPSRRQALALAVEVRALLGPPQR